LQNLNDNRLVKNQSESLSKHFSILNLIFKSLESIGDLNEVFRKIPSLLIEVISFDSFHAGFYQAKSDTVNWIFTTNESQLEKRVFKSEEDEMVSLAICRKETVYSNLAQKKIFSLNKNEEICLRENRILSKSGIVTPIVTNDEIFGLINMTSANPDLFTERDAFLMSIVASQLGLALENFKQAVEIEEKEKLRSMVELASSVGHELNQPLTGITGYCALIKEDLKESDSIYNDIVEIEKQATRLEKLVYKFQNLLYLENISVND